MKTYLCGLFLLLMGTAGLFAQEAPAAAPAAAGNGTATPPPPSKSLFAKVKEGGIIMIPIALCSVFTVYLIGDGVIRTSQKKTAPVFYEKQIKALFQQGDYNGAYQFCKANPSALTNVLRVGISLLGEGKEAVEEGMIGELGKENSKIQTWISYLSVIGVCTPMIGLLGTVTGMMGAFATLGSSGIGDPSSLSAAIGEVLIATASGLFIAIPAFGSFYFLRNRATDSIHHIQDILNSLFRKMPYEAMAGFHIGDDVIYAAQPVWTRPEGVPAEAYATAEPTAEGAGS